MSLRSIVVGITGVCVVLLGTSWAAADLINGSFEAPVVAENTEWEGTPDGWNILGGGRTYIANGTAAQAYGGPNPDGDQVWQTTNGWLWQNTGIVMQAGWTYTADFSASGLGANGGVSCHLLHATDTASRGSTMLDTGTIAIGSQTWVPVSASIEMTGANALHVGDYLTVEICAADEGQWRGFDAVSVTSTPPVPEPSSVVLLAMGLIGLLAYAWRKRK